MRRRRFLEAAAGSLLAGPWLGGLTSPFLSSGWSRPIPAGRKGRRMLSNHDGAIMGSEPPLTAEHFRQVVRSYQGTPVDTICFCLGDREVYHYESEVAEVFGRRHGTFKSDWDWRVYENTRQLIESGKGPLATFAEVCREEGMGLFGSFRMNSHYGVDPASPHHSEFRLKHPQWLIGHPAGYSKESKEFGIRMGLNYAIPEVREHMAATIVEVFTRFRVDGVELDFMRHPAFFKLHEAVENHHHMTDMLRHIKRRRDQVSRETGRKIELAMRVPPTFADALRVGLDVRTWIREGLVDLLIAGGGFIPFDMPFESFVEAARGTDCQVLGGLELLRFMTGPTPDLDITRAIAMRFWQGGADGLQLFNYFAQPTDWKRQLFQEIGDPERLASLDKRYQMDKRRWFPGGWNNHGAAFSSAVPAVQLPVDLTETPPGGGPRLQLRISDDLESATRKGILDSVKLRLLFENRTLQDRVEVHLNGERLPDKQSSTFDLVSYWNRTRGPYQGEYLTGTLEYDVACPPLKQGKNVIQVRLVKRTPNLTAPLTLGLVEASVHYKSG